MSMDFMYPAGPRVVPPDLTRPTRAYRTHAWLAMGGLLLFVLLYLALASWFTWTAYRLFASLAHGGDPLWTFVAGTCSAFLAVFMCEGAGVRQAPARDRRHRSHRVRAAAPVRLHAIDWRTKQVHRARIWRVPLAARERGGVLRPERSQSAVSVT